MLLTGSENIDLRGSITKADLLFFVTDSADLLMLNQQHFTCKPANQEVSHTVILPPIVSVL